MDLHFTSATATEDERQAIDAALNSVTLSSSKGDSDQGPRAKRHLLLPILHAIGERIGWISPGALNYACEKLTVPPAEAYGVATFYGMFSTKPRSPAVLHACDDIACMRSAPYDVPPEVTVLRSPCLGLCERAPAAMLSVAGVRPVHEQIAPADTHAIAQGFARASRGEHSNEAPRPHAGGSSIRLLERVAAGVDPASLDAYRAHGGYAALHKALEIGPDAVIAEVTASKLLGRGGAAFPTGRKMDAVARAKARPHYVICNADESEPGTFKDRILMECDPFALVEAIAIAGYATGCERGFIYIRGEYPLATHRLQHAIDAARAAGLLGERIAGSTFSFDIEIRRGAGAYICGEETALFNSIEGKRGEPRSKPPFPVEAGLFGKPTQVNNVETLANLLPILLDGGAAYARTGTPGSTGTRLFCLSGSVAKPGLYEVAHGVTLGDLIAMAGGVANGRALQAVLLGGAAGSFVGPSALSMPLSFEGSRAIGATLGSGVVMLFDDTVDLAPVVVRIARFFREESCGQCVPCRVGTVRQEEALERLLHGGRDGAGVARDVALLNEIGRAMRDASICGLGQTAASAVASAQSFLRVLAPEGAP